MWTLSVFFLLYDSKLNIFGLRTKQWRHTKQMTTEIMEAFFKWSSVCLVWWKKSRRVVWRKGWVCLCFQAVPDIKTYSEPSYSQNEDDSQHHYDVGDLHTWGWQQATWCCGKRGMMNEWQNVYENTEQTRPSAGTPTCLLPPLQMVVLSNQQLESDGGGDPPGKLMDLPAKRSTPAVTSTR